ncbi:MAG: dimethylsulfonioproprionate lyase family protein [Alphaproteobacteria bacterium]|jgi:hypothetical protein|nr:dimethylsulfonioproprionate lyase family protein [Alphaproteobacteria bacterium]MDP6588254.1 dimethylsulfonioproprionate lyase family protein [Alphaproteobacteria bacterium]MDP6818851.1 dimethylsulfonioproprionate lyase family protein [Alphaproteobacteria bacterium]
MAPEAALGRMLAAAVALCESRADEDGAAAGHFAGIAGQALAAPINPDPPAPRRLPACRHLASVEAAVLAEMAESLHWTQNPNYLGDPKMRAFVQDYAYAELLGPGGIAVSEDAALGLLLIGPHRYYPPHHHPARETYLTVAGEADWWRHGEDWRTLPAASFITHEPDMVHAMRTAEQPLLALYAWSGEIGTPARLV